MKPTEKKRDYYYHPECGGAGMCDGHVDERTGICGQCGEQAEKNWITVERGTIWYRVDANRTTRRFSIAVDGCVDQEQYERKLIAALKRAGADCDSTWMDGCKQPDGRDGYYGHSLPQKLGGGFSPDGRFCVRRIN